MTDSDRWVRIEALFHQALARPPEERDAFVVSSSAGDSGLQREVRLLLAQAASGMRGVVDRPVIAAAHPAEPSPGVRVGSRIAVYELTGPIGAGGMGEVYRARDTRLGRDVAIKILPHAVSADGERLRRLDREARLLAALNHPNIATIYGLEDAGDTRAIVMELVEGETLAERIGRLRRKGSVPAAETLRIARQIAEALDAAHEKGIIHRDLKPANIKITPDGVVKVLDFGLAKAASGDGAPTDLTQSPTMTVGGTREGVVLGTPAYMSPEQARGQSVDKRMDIWAFGCVLYEMLTGRAAFARGTTSDTLAAIIEREPDWSAIPSSTPAIVLHLLRRCLNKDPKQRLRDIGDARVDLHEALNAPAQSTAVIVPASRAASWWAWSATTAVIIAAGLGLWVLSRTPWQNPLASAQFTRYTDFEGSELDAAISPDGQFIVFLSNRSGPYEAWLSQVGSGQFVNVSNGRIEALLNDEVRNVGLSPDGQIWFRGDRTDSLGQRVGAGTVVAPVIGGELRPLLDRGINPVWSRDGSRLLYHEPGPGDPIFVADRNGRNPTRVHIAPPGIHSHYLNWSPDGRFIYFVGGIPPSEMDVWRVPASGGTAERLTFHNSSVAYPVFIDDGTLLYRATAEDGSGPWLYALDVERRATHRVALGVEQYLSIAASADGRRLVATVSNPIGGLWSAPVTTAVVSESSTERVPVPAVTALSPRFGPNYFLYLSSKEGARGLWRFQDGKATELLKPTEGGLLVPPSVSADGMQLAFTARVNGRGRLYAMNVDGTDVRAIADTLDVRDSPSWSPDGKWLVAAAGDGLVKVPLDGGPPVRLVEGLVRLPIWSPDGRFILYSEALQGPGYTVKGISPDGMPHPIPPLWVRRGGDRYRLLPDSKQVVYIGGDYGRQDFWLLNLETAARRQLTDLQPGFSIKGFDLSPDGKRILFDRIRENSDVVLIDLPRRQR